MSRYTNTFLSLSDRELEEAAKNGLMHYAQCVEEGSDMDRRFFATRAEAEAAAIEFSKFDEASGTSWAYEARSMALDEDGDLMVAEDDDEFADA